MFPCYSFPKGTLFGGKTFLHHFILFHISKAKIYRLVYCSISAMYVAICMLSISGKFSLVSFALQIEPAPNKPKQRIPVNLPSSLVITTLHSVNNTGVQANESQRILG
ncbi:hypothetical protein RIF29_21059 [Crotalaria pallida]|uniref:Uncharacterized protein n=1 Tax=Crotalaria pallida TaxID=3830 RepID=A0AAN9ID17_CROPI